MVSPSEINELHAKLMTELDAGHNDAVKLSKTLFGNSALSSIGMEADAIRSELDSVKAKLSSRPGNTVLKDKKRIKGINILIKTYTVEADYINSKILEAKQFLNNPDELKKYLVDLTFKVRVFGESTQFYTKGLKETLADVGNLKSQIIDFFKKRKMGDMVALIRWEKLGKLDEKTVDQNLISGSPKQYRKKKIKFFATSKSDIPYSAVDFFSIGHVLMGQIAYFITYALVNADFGPIYDAIGSPLKPNFWAIVVSVIVGIAWEPIENIILWKMGLKFESKRDSILNVVFDIIFVTCGALFAYSIHVWQVNLTIVIIEFILFFSIRWYFLNKT
jgi:hypothetical protein